MNKPLSLHKLLATLLTIVAVFAGQQAFATITSPMSLTGNSALMNGQYYHVWKTEGFLGYFAQPRTEGSSYTFNGQNIGLQGGAVRITGTLNFTQADDFTDVTTGSTVTVEFYSTNFWFFSAEVKKLDGTSVSGCSYSASSDHSSITVTIPSGKTFGNIYLGYSVHPQMTESNTTISGIEATYIYQGSAIRPQPTVVYTNPNHSQTTLTLNTDYTLSYTNNNGPGIATVIITGAGEYAGTLTRTYTIRNIDLSDFNSLGNNTYEITNKDDLDHLALLVDVAANDCQGLTFKQTADITYSHGSSTTENNFTQIGGYFGGDKNFSGTYDGQNHTISGIRVYKSPSTNTNENKNVALFGRISGATIQNVILTDARITGYRYVGGLVGNKASGTVQNCLVVGSTITCGNTYGGALFGSNSGTLTANHYRNCTVNNTTNATNVGVGNGSSSSDMAGARSVHPLTIQNANITATGESVAYQGTTYYASNTQITLGYNNLPAGYTLTYTLNGTALSGNTFTMPANDNATVNATLTPITYNITYDLDGGSVATANPTTYNVTTPTFTLNNPTKAGYTFTGWTGSNGTTPQTEVTIAQGSTGNLNYTAQWTQYAFTLSLGTDITASGTVAFTYEGTDYYAVGTEITLAYGGTIPEGYRPLYSVNGNAIVGNTFEMPTADVIVDAVLLERYYTFNSTTGVLALLWGEFNKDNKWGSEVTESAVTSVTATDEVSFTGDCSHLFQGFTNCTSMDLTDVNTANVTNMSHMFRNCSGLQSLNISGWNTANVTDMSYMFYNCSGLQSLDLSGWNTANVTDMSGMFRSCSGLQSLDLSGWSTANVTYMSGMFYSCSGLQSLDLSGWNTAMVTDMSWMFDGCSGLQSLIVSGWNTANVTNMSDMFYGCSGLQSLNVSGWNTANVTDMKYMFYGCSGLQSLNISGWNTANVSDMSYMFRNCSDLPSLDLSGWNTANVTDMSGMFRSCSGLPSLDLSGWNTDNVTNMNYMFYGCSGLQSLDVSGWNTDKVIIMGYMFYNCSSLPSLDLSGWNTANVTYMSDMFYGCSGLQSLIISGWNTAKVTNMSHMFRNCSGLQSLDLSGWNTANVSDMSYMFQYCTNLVTIYVGEGWNTIHVDIQHSSNMFTNCTSLVGGMGTAYDANHIDKEYARIDGGPDNPGYFTGRFTKEIAGYGNDENPGGYYLIASPVGTVNPENVGNMTSNAFDLYRFNQAANLEWENWKDQNDGGYELVSGKGYLYANSEDVTLSFTGTPIEGDTYDVTLDKSADAEFAGWNLVGNPFADTAYLQGDGAFYTMNEAGTELEANTSLTSIAPMEGVFVFAEEDGETLTFTTEEPSKNGKGLVLNISHTQTSGVSAPELVPEPVEGREGAGVSTLRQAQGSTTAILDRAIVRFDEGGVLPKFQMRSSSTKVYFPMDGKEYAVVNVGRDGVHTVSTIDVNFKAEHNGTYTLAFSTEGVTFRYLHLIDNITGADIDLLSAGDCGSSPTMTVSDVNPTNPNPEGVIAGSDPQSLTPSYTFEAKTTDGANRFRLVFSICGDANGDNGPSTGSGTFAFIDASGNIIITADMDNATLQVIDAMGRVIVSRDVSGNVSTNGMTPGVYVLRLMNGDDLKTQKIVIQ